MAKDYYTTKDISQLTGASPAIVRVYTDIYRRYFSTEATPEPGRTRRFTPDDLRLIAYVYHLTQDQSYTRDQVQDALAAGELATFDWSPTVEEPEEPTTGAADDTTALVPLANLRAVELLRQQADADKADALERLADAQQRIEELQRELGKAQGELAGHKAARYRAPAWWRSLFGGAGE